MLIIYVKSQHFPQKQQIFKTSHFKMQVLANFFPFPTSRYGNPFRYGPMIRNFRSPNPMARQSSAEEVRGQPDDVARQG